MTKAQLKKLKELDAFLKENKMSLQGVNVSLGFNLHKYHKTNNIIDTYVRLNLGIGYTRGRDSYIQELNDLPKVKEFYHIDKNGKLKSCM